MASTHFSYPRRDRRIIPTISNTMITAHALASVINNSTPVIHRRSKHPIAITAEPATSLPGNDSRHAAITARIIIRTIQPICKPLSFHTSIVANDWDIRVSE